MPSLCSHCLMNICESVATVGEKHFHPECLVCHNCKRSLQNVSFRMRENVLYCDKCFKTVTAVKCSECGSLIKGKNRVEAMGQFYHPRHFVCFSCKRQLVKPLFVKKMVSVNGVSSNYGFCPDCASELDNTMCSECSQALDDNLVYQDGSYVHADCGCVEGTRNPSNLPLSASSSSCEEEKQVDDRVAPLNQVVQRGAVAMEPMKPKEPKEPTEPKSVAGATAPLRPSYYPSQYRAARPVRPEDVVSSEPLNHMAGFETAGSVVERSEAFEREEDLPVPAKKFEDAQFTSQGAIPERVQAFGRRETPMDEAPKKFEDTDFVSQGPMAERVQAFGRRETPVEEPAKKFEDADFVSQGSMAERIQAFGRRETPVDEAPKKFEDTDFVSQGSMAERMKAFGKKENLPTPEEAEEDPDFIPQGSMAERMKAFENHSEEPKEA